MYRKFSVSAKEVLLPSSYTESKLEQAGVRTLRCLVQLSVEEANKKLGRRAYKEIVKGLSKSGLSFGMTNDEIRTWVPDHDPEIIKSRRK